MRAQSKSGQNARDGESASLHATTDTDGTLHLAGALTVWTLSGLPRAAVARIALDDLAHLDTAGAWALLEARRAGARLSGASARHAALIETVAEAEPDAAASSPAPGGLRHLLDSTGRGVVAALAYLSQLAEYLGRFIASLARALRHPSRFPMTSLVYHCNETGLRAVPIVVVMAFLIGVVLTFQGAAQLRQFGAEIFVVDLIAISILRELGILLTAIIVAGRTASALTAAIGSMKMREEIDAMRTLGLDPDMRLVLPRTLALVITLPILGLIANVAGLVGGAAMSWIELGISPALFLARLSETDVSHAIVGLSKAPVFALIIGVVGCHAGMRVGSDADSLGRMTSFAVVSAIFAVIIADAAFSVFFAQVNL